MSLHQQQVNHFNRGFSKLPSIGSKTILKQDETLLDDEEVEAEAESDEEEAQDESQELSNGDAEFSHFPPVENEQMKLTEAAQEWDENQQSEEEEEEGDEDCGGAKDDILDIDMGEQDDEEQEEESDKGYSESENQDEISTNEELQQFENNSERNKEGSVRSQVFQLEDEDDEEYQPKDEAEAEQEQEESEVEEHKEMHEPPSDKITMRSDLAQLLLDDAADSTSEEDSHDPPHFEVDNDYYDSEEECAYGELSNANQGNQESEAFKKDGDEEKEEEVEQKHELLQSSSETVIQGQMDEFVDQQNNDENEWEEMDDEGSEMQNTSTSIPLPQSSSQIIQAQGESEWETEQEVVKTRQIPRKKKKRASARSSSSRKSIAKESQPQSPKLETAAPADNVISVSVSSTLKQAPKRASITRAMEPIQAPAAPVEPPKEEPVKVSIPSLSKSSSKKQGLVFIPLNEESPSTKHPNRSFSRMPSRSGSASTRRASTNDLAQAAEPVSVVQRTSSSAKSHVAEITNNPENVQEETVAPATQGSPDKKGVPRQKQLTNRTLIRNALIHVCLAGSVNSQVKQDVLEVNIIYNALLLTVESNLKTKRLSMRVRIRTSSSSSAKSTISHSEVCMPWTPSAPKPLRCISKAKAQTSLKHRVLQSTISTIRVGERSR